MLNLQGAGVPGRGGRELVEERADITRLGMLTVKARSDGVLHGGLRVKVELKRWSCALHDGKKTTKRGGKRDQEIGDIKSMS